VTRVKRGDAEHTPVSELPSRGWVSTERWLCELLASADAGCGELPAHAMRIGELVEVVGRRVGLAEAASRHLARMSRFHDVGKITVPSWILRKPAPLTRLERAIVESHTLNGHALLAGSAAHSRFLRAASEIALMHHEDFDGSGYPLGLRGDEIPLGARIVRVCDVFDALISDRPYRAAIGEAEALKVVYAGRGREFDPDVVQALLDVRARTSSEPAFAA
jgi:putative two-component system response regulator